MRFSDFHPWGSIYASFGRCQPQSIPEPETRERYSDEQSHALALYLHSRTVPPNPNPPRNPEEKATRRSIPAAPVSARLEDNGFGAPGRQAGGDARGPIPPPTAS